MNSSFMSQTKISKKAFKNLIRLINVSLVSSRLVSIFNCENETEIVDAGYNNAFQSRRQIINARKARQKS